MRNTIDLRGFEKKIIKKLSDDFVGRNQKGECISFTNYYMEKNSNPFFAISGEFHFSRCEAHRWEDELIKMKMAGINTIATYVFWIHHEEIEGDFDFRGRKDLRAFIELCKKHKLFVIIRIGPFAHGEVRNGGLPDWLYGKPFEVRHTNEGFIDCTRKYYQQISNQVEGLFYKDDGPIVGIQLDNEYMHSSAPWEMTTGISNEWVYGGSEGDAYMHRLKDLTLECGMIPAFYTCTGWGGAATPEDMMPLWGGYAYRPWLFYASRDVHPSTEEYVYYDFHNNDIPSSNDFQPKYLPEDKPYACCEMGGGMMCSYYYRFQLPYKSVDAMANIKMASGCNFLGYYVFQGGSNPIGKSGTYMNENQVPKISYDYQAALGEFGQIRESYKRLKCLHYFTAAFGEELCGMKTALPDGASQIEPKDLDTLRFAIRSNGSSGYVFLNNFQDHEITKPKKDREIHIQLDNEDIVFDKLSLDSDENCILPFNMRIGKILLKKATAQPVTFFDVEGETTYVFMKPDGMRPTFKFEEGVYIDGVEVNEISLNIADRVSVFEVNNDTQKIKILCLDRALSNNMYMYNDNGIIISEGAVLVDDNGVRVESYEPKASIYAYPESCLEGTKSLKCQKSDIKPFSMYQLSGTEKSFEPNVEQVGEGRYSISIDEFNMEGIKDALLQIEYIGDIGQAFIHGVMINDNFSNGAVWEIGLKELADQLETKAITLYITPLKEGINVNVESSMAARMEEVGKFVAKLENLAIKPIYEFKVL